MKIVFAAVPLINTRVPPLSIALLAAQMKKDGHEVKSFDFNIETYQAVSEELKEYWKFYKGFQWIDNEYFETVIYPNVIGQNLERWVEKILAEKPDVVGISVTLSPSGRKLAQRLKEARPDLKIVIGGPSCSTFYDDSEKSPGPLYDAVVHNEGELTLSELVAEYARTGKLLAVPGASVLDDEGKIKFGGLREPKIALDDMPPPDFDDFDFGLYVDADDPGQARREIPYYTSRGCPARCNFCMDYKMWDSRFRQKSPQRIIEEMEYLSQRYGQKNFMLIELIFNGHIPKMRELTAELKRRNHGFTFWGHGRIDPRLDVETLQLLKDAGFRWFIFGLEAASDPLLKIMRKGYSAETADRVMSNMRTVGLGCSVNIIVGHPGETWDDYRTTLNFVWKHRLAIGHAPGITACAVMPGSDIFLYPEKFGIRNEPGHKPDAVEWVSEDGENTPAVREFRREFMASAFKKFRFMTDPKTKPDFDVAELPDPEKLFRKQQRAMRPPFSAIESLRRYIPAIRNIRAALRA